MKNKSGYSLLEILGATAIIGILLGLVGSAAYSARQRAYTSIANSECQQIASAFKSYWIAHRAWPQGFSAQSDIQLSRQRLGPLIGETGSLPLLNVPPDRFEGDGSNAYFADPWGNPYVISLGQQQEIAVENQYEGVVAFPARFRYYMDTPTNYVNWANSDSDFWWN